MSCDYCAGMATRRLRLLLRIWVVVFALGALDFLVFPYLTVRIVNAGGAALGMRAVAALNAGQDFWLTLAVPYMIMVAAFSWVAQSGARIAAQPVQFLMLAKASSSLTSLALFLFGGFPYAFLANFVVDGAIVLITYWFYRAARPELVYPA
jgi:hypothetical protein